VVFLLSVDKQLFLENTMQVFSGFNSNNTQQSFIVEHHLKIIFFLALRLSWIDEAGKARVQPAC